MDVLKTFHEHEHVKQGCHAFFFDIEKKSEKISIIIFDQLG